MEKSALPPGESWRAPSDAPAGRSTPLATAAVHHVNGRPLKGPFPDGLATAMFGLGCFWGAERLFWRLPGVYVTMVGYAGGTTPNPTYEEVCTGRTGHAEVVRLLFDPSVISYGELVRTFLEGHDPTQGLRQGNDVGPQYRSVLFYDGEGQRRTAETTIGLYARALAAAGRRAIITTEIGPAPDFYYAEAYHQQYLSKNPNGYCGHGGTGVACPLPVAGNG